MPTLQTAVNYWHDDRCAKAFWNQKELPPYRELLHDTVAWLDVHPGHRWLDLGCGSGQLSQALWQISGGQLREVVGFDCAAVNALAYERLREKLQPAPGERLRFEQRDFNDGLPDHETGQFDGVVCGLALQYAESWSAAEGRWTTDAYDAMLGEIHRVLRPGGLFVVSLNVPNPAWWRVAWSAIGAIASVKNRLKYLERAWRMYRYGNWLTRQARLGRFHYLPAETIHAKLAGTGTGFTAIEHRLSFAKQAYLFRCRKPARS